MNIDFQQGVVIYPIDSGLQSFLSYSGGFVTLTTTNGRTDVAFAYGSENYLLSESSNVTNAWGPLPSSTDCWLYWDINLQSGVRTFGFTTLAPIYSAATPSSPVEGQCWFNTGLRKMYVYTSGNFREALRVFAAKVNNSTFTPLGSGNALKPFAGSQAGLNTPNTPTGRIVVGDTGLPIRRSDGKFFTSEDNFFVNGSPVNVIRLEANILTATAYEPIAKFQVVKFSAFGLISLAGYDDTGNATIAMAMEDLDGQEVGTVCVQGHVTNPSWNWSTVGAKLWISEAGVLTEFDPHVTNALIYPQSQVAVGRVVTPTSILFDQGLGGKGDRGEKGLSGGVQYADAVTYGVTRLSLNPAAFETPIAVGDNDPRLSNKVLKAGDTMTGPLVFTGGSSQVTLPNLPTIGAHAANKTYVDSAVSGIDLSSRVAKAGDTMSGYLTLNADPVNALHAVPKQYLESSITTAINGLTAPYDISMFMGGTMGDQNEISTGALIPRTIFIASANAHIAKALVAPTALSQYTIVKVTAGVETQIGTISFNIAATTGTVVITSNTTLVAGDTLAIKVANIAPDTTIQNVFVTIIGCAALTQCAVV